MPAHSGMLVKGTMLRRKEVRRRVATVLFRSLTPGADVRLKSAKTVSAFRPRLCNCRLRTGCGRSRRMWNNRNKGTSTLHGFQHEYSKEFCFSTGEAWSVFRRTVHK